MEHGYGELTKKFKSRITEYLRETLTEDVIDEGIYSDATDEDYIDTSELNNYIKEIVSEYDIDFGKIELEDIGDSCDFSRILEDNISKSNYDGENFGGGFGNNNGDSSYGAIEDLVDRS